MDGRSVATWRPGSGTVCPAKSGTGWRRPLDRRPLAVDPWLDRNQLSFLRPCLRGGCVFSHGRPRSGAVAFSFSLSTEGEEAMTQNELNRAVARATGESVAVISSMGFVPLTRAPANVNRGPSIGTRRSRRGASHCNPAVKGRPSLPDRLRLVSGVPELRLGDASSVLPFFQKASPLITLTRKLARQVQDVFRRGLPRLNPPAVVLRTDHEGLRISAWSPEVALEYRETGLHASEQISLPLAALKRCAGSRSEAVTVERGDSDRVVLRWNDLGIPQVAEFDAAGNPRGVSGNSREEFAGRPGISGRLAGRDRHHGFPNPVAMPSTASAYVARAAGSTRLTVGRP